MRRFVCHKEVKAFKINDITQMSYGKFRLYGKGRDNLEVTAIVGDDYVNKHAPAIGGYFVEYKDGYQSFSPAKAFEDGYKEIGSASVVTLWPGLIVEVSGETYEINMEEGQAHPIKQTPMPTFKPISI